MVSIHTDATTKPRVVRLLLRGQLDLTALDAFREALTRAARLRWPVELDLVGIDFIDGSGLGMLIDATARARRAGIQLAIGDVSRCVRRLVAITHTGDLLPPLYVGARPGSTPGRAFSGGRSAVGQSAGSWL